MFRRVSFFIFLLLAAVITAEEVYLRLLKKEPFVLFSCNVVGSPRFSWVINGRGIGAFTSSNSEKVIWREQSEYNYSATLLSFRNNSGQISFDSVLIVLMQDNKTVNVNCLSENNSSNTISLANAITDVAHTPTTNNYLYVLPLLENIRIVRGNTVTTNILICASISKGQVWVTDKKDRIELNGNFGSHNATPAANNDLLRLQAFSLGMQDSYFVTILHLTDDAISNVTCLADGSSVTYLRDSSASTTSLPGGSSTARYGPSTPVPSKSFKTLAMPTMLAVLLMIPIVIT